MAISEESVLETPLGAVSFVSIGEGQVTVALHSLLTDRGAFDEVAGHIGGRFVSVDLPGFGRTDPAQPSIDDYAHRIAAALECPGIGAGNLTLMGNGLGAFVALGAAIHHGDLIDRLVLVGCGAAFPEPAKAAFTNMVQAVSTGGMEAVIPIALRRIFTEDYLEAHPDMAEARSEVLRRTDPDAFITACTALHSLDYRPLATSVRTATLIVVGEKDQATPPELADELHGLIPGSTLVRVPGVAHAPQIQDPDGFLKAIEPFLEGR